ncbi:PLD nuclease N-terminal domain-containing protein [Isoptericola sp. BMS4]|uniref:PLD nuclease N-terminal domain-containing protein n=1 Tax=Isoptericola sp. BMS4 TaxID=2527875 RepID=UPI0014200F2C|nr:PLD nuclease N-terminal domain-containing protein [Isoptericola sp. BMS4]
MFRVVLTLLVVGLDVYALVDLSNSEEEDRGGLPRWLWAVIILLLPVFGAVAWIVMRQTGRRASGGGGRPRRPGRGPQRPSGPAAPDDDPDFLWKLEQERRRRERGRSDDT